MDEAFAQAAIAPLPQTLHAAWEATVCSVLTVGTLTIPGKVWQHGVSGAGGGKRGVHSEHLGYILAEMQFLQRAYPGGTW